MKSSVVIPNFNGQKLLEKNLPGVLLLSVDEIIIVDDASTDNSVNFLSEKYPKIKIIKNETNLGFIKSVNKGVEKASEEIIILLNNDVAPKDDFMGIINKYFENSKTFAVSFNEPNWSYAKAYFINGFIEHFPGPKSDKPHITFWASGGSAAFSKKIWEELNGFDEIFEPFYWEDIDLSFRAWKSGYEVWWEPNAVVSHNHETTISSKYSKKYIDEISERNRLLFIWKNITDEDLVKEHKKFLVERLKNPRFWKPFLKAQLKKNQIKKSKYNISDKEIFEKFKETRTERSRSAVIVNYNTNKYLDSCIKDLADNSEVIIVDNKSDEPPSIKNAKLIINDKNKGFANAVNLGVKNSTGEFILLLNPDTRMSKEALDKLIEFYKSHNDCGIAAPKLVGYNNVVQKSVRKFPTIIGAFKEYILGQKGEYDFYLPDKTCPVDVVVGACMLIKKDLFEKIGGLSEKYFLYYEDIDLCKKIKVMGLKVYFLPEVEIFHEIGSSSNEKSYDLLVQSSKTYHGILAFQIISFIIKLGSRFKK